MLLSRIEIKNPKKFRKQSNYHNNNNDDYYYDDNKKLYSRIEWSYPRNFYSTTVDGRSEHMYFWLNIEFKNLISFLKVGSIIRLDFRRDKIEVEKKKEETIFYFDANSLYHYSVRNNDEIYKLVCPSLYGRCLMDLNRLLNPNRLLLITEQSWTKTKQTWNHMNLNELIQIDT